MEVNKLIKNWEEWEKGFVENESAWNFISTLLSSRTKEISHFYKHKNKKDN